jgi:subtilisin family serine protease
MFRSPKRLNRLFLLLFLSLILIPRPLSAQTDAAPESTAEATAQNTPEAPAETPLPPTATETLIPVVFTEVLPPTPTATVTEAVTPELTETQPIDITAEASEPPISQETAEATLETTPPRTEVPAFDSATPEATEQAALTDELLINYNPNASQTEIDALLAALNAVELERIPQIGVMRVRVPSQYAEVEDATEALTSSASEALAAGANAIEENTRLELMYTPNDPNYGSGQWALNNAYGIHAPNAWDLAPRRGQGVIVAVIDSGVDLRHPDLRGQLVPGWNFGDDNNNPDDSVNGHGTHVAGIIAARTNNNLGVAGMAFNARIMPLKATTGSTFEATLFDVAGSIVYAVDHGAKVINMSLGHCTLDPNSQYPRSIWGAMSYADAKNVVIVVAAGNGNGQTGCSNSNYNMIAQHPAVISVAASDINGVSAGLNRGYNANDGIDIAAPGIDIRSTFPLGLGQFEVKSGTSMAAPYVSAVVALLISEGVVSTPDEAREALTCTAWDVNGGGRDNYYGYGIVQADWALSWRAGAGCDAVGRHDRIENAFAIARLPYNNLQAVDFRSAAVNANDPVICGRNPGTNYVQTFWYQFTPAASGFYQFSTYGSSYNTLIGVFAGQPNLLRPLTCNDDSGANAQSFVSASLEARQTYYLVVATSGSTRVDGQSMRLDIRPIFPTGRDLQENLLAYSRAITPTAFAGASGRKVVQFNNGDAAFFSFRGNSLDIVSAGPISVFINNNFIQTINNPQLASTTINTGATGQLSDVTLLATGAALLDKVRLYDALMRPVAGLRDDRDPNIFYSGSGWSQDVSADNYRATITATSSAGDYFEFRGRGSAFVIRRNLSPDAGSISVFVDGRFYGDFSNVSAGDLVNIPLVIGNLANTDHTIRVRNTSASRLEIDGVEVAAPAALPAGRLINDTDRGIRYSGQTNTLKENSAFGRTLHQLYVGGEAQFRFNGNGFCIGYADGDNVAITVDNAPYGSFNADGGGEWCSNRLSAGLHHVSVRQTGSFLALDYVFPWQAPVLSPASNRGGLVQETDKAFLYSYDIVNGRAVSHWKPANGAPVVVPRGIGRFQGSARRTLVDGATIQFWINGSGFVLYTSVQAYMGEYDIYVDGVFNRTLDLWNGQNDPWQPLALGITGLSPGLHKIELRADTNGNFAPVDFDGARVIP